MTGRNGGAHPERCDNFVADPYRRPVLPDTDQAGIRTGSELIERRMLE